MKSIAILRPNANFNPQQFASLVHGEEKAVWRATVDGALLETHYNLATFGSVVLIFQTPNLDDARAILAGFPFIAAGLFDVEWIPLKPYNGLANLFAPEHGFTQVLPTEWTNP